MKRITIILTFFGIVGFALNLVSIDPIVTDDFVKVVLTFDGTPTYKFDSDFSKTSFTLTIPNSFLRVSGGTLPVRVGPLEMINVLSMGNSTVIGFHTIIPSKPKVRVAGKIMEVSFPRSKQRIDVVFTGGGIDLKTAVNYLAEYLKLNVIVSDSVGGKIVDLKLNNIAPEDALRSLMMSLDDVFYSYFSDGTMFVGNYNEVSSKFAKFWGVYKVGTDVMEILKEVLPEDAFVNYIKNKSLLFVYGTPETHRLISTMLSKGPPTVETRFDYDGLDRETISKFLESLKKLYGSFEYVFVPNKTELILKGEVNVVDKIREKLREILPPPIIKEEHGEILVEVVDSEKAVKVLKEELGVDATKVSKNIVSVPLEVSKKSVVDILRKRGLLPKSWKSITLPLYMKNYLDKIADIAGVPKENIVVMELETVGEIIVYVRGENAEYFFKLVGDFQRKLSGDRWRYTKVVDLGLKGDALGEISRLVSDYMEGSVSITPYTVLGSVVIRAEDLESLEKAEELLRRKAEDLKAQEETKAEVKPEIGERWISSIVSVSIPNEYVDQIKSYISFSTNGEVEMEYYPDLNRAILKSKDEYLLDKAKELLADAVSKLPRYVETGEKEEAQSIRIIQRIEGMTDEAISKIAELFNVLIVPVNGGYILKGKEGDLWNFTDLIERLKALSGFGKVSKVLEKPSNFPKEVLDYLKNRFSDVSVFDLGTKILLMGPKSSVDGFVSVYREVSESLPKAESKKTVLKFLDADVSGEDLEKLSDVFNVNVVSLSRGFLASGYERDVERFVNFIEKYSKKSVDEKIVVLERVPSLAEEILKKLTQSHPGVSVFETEDHLIVLGKKDEVEKFKDTYLEISKKVSEVSKKIIVDIEEVGKEFLSEEFSDFLKAIGLKVETFYAEGIGVLVLKGTQSDVESAKEYIERFKSGTKTEGFLKTLKYPEGFPISEFLKSAEGNFDLKISVVESSRIMVITGKDENELSRFEGFYKEFLKKVGNVEKPKKMRKFLSIPKDFPVEPFVETVKKTVEGVEVVPYPDLNYVLVVADSTSQIDSVVDVYNQILDLYTKSVPATSLEATRTEMEKYDEFIPIPENFPTKSFIESVKTTLENVKIIVYPKHLYVVADSKKSLEKVKKMLSEIASVYKVEKKVEEKVEEKPINAEKVKRFLKIPENFPVDSFIESVGKTIKGVEIVKFPGYLLLIADSESVVENVEEIYKKVLEMIPKVEKVKKEFVRTLEYPEDFPIDDFLSGIKDMFNLKISVVKSLNKIVVSGTDEKEYEKFLSLYSDFLEGLKKEILKVSIDVPENFPIDQFIELVGSTLPDVKITPYTALGYIVVEAKSEAEINQVKSLIDKTVEKMKEKPVEKKDIVWIDKGLINVEAQGVSLFDLLNELFKKTGKSVVFKYSPTDNVYISLRNMEYNKLLRILEDYGIKITLKDGIYVVEKKEEVFEGKPEKETGYRIYKVYHNFERVKKVVELFGGNAYIDEETGNLIISGLDDDKLKIVEKIMNEISKPLKQIEIEARIVDKSIIDELEKMRNININIPLSENENVKISGDSIKLNAFVMSAQDYEKFLSALKSGMINLEILDRKSNSLSEVLASPKITTTSGKEARIVIGEKIPYRIKSPEGETVGVEYAEIGIILKITPVVRDDGTIDMTIFIRVSSSSDSDNSAEGDLPPTEKVREAQTQVIINDGDTVVIGGLTRDVTIKRVTKLPLLGDLPIIGQFFRSENEKKERRELIIFITAKVVSEW